MPHAFAHILIYTSNVSVFFPFFSCSHTQPRHRCRPKKKNAVCSTLSQPRHRTRLNMLKRPSSFQGVVSEHRCQFLDFWWVRAPSPSMCGSGVKLPGSSPPMFLSGSQNTWDATLQLQEHMCAQLFAQHHDEQRTFVVFFFPQPCELHTLSERRKIFHDASSWRLVPIWLGWYCITRTYPDLRPYRCCSRLLHAVLVSWPRPEASAAASGGDGHVCDVRSSLRERDAERRLCSTRTIALYPTLRVMCVRVRARVFVRMQTHHWRQWHASTTSARVFVCSASLHFTSHHSYFRSSLLRHPSPPFFSLNFCFCFVLLRCSRWGTILGPEQANSYRFSLGMRISLSICGACLVARSTAFGSTTTLRTSAV